MKEKEKKKKKKKALTSEKEVQKKKKKAKEEPGKKKKKQSPVRKEEKKIPEKSVSFVGPEAVKMLEALADMTRLQILELLKEKELCATEILVQVPVVQSTLSHHMKVLTESGLVLCRKSGRKVMYVRNAEAFKDLASALTEYGGR